MFYFVNGLFSVGVACLIQLMVIFCCCSHFRWMPPLPSTQRPVMMRL
uniref:Uncharacterized protein n=1 Tax=Arundo donax TaxID=35708 RepID=A0A0A9GUZ5_ARUDO